MSKRKSTILIVDDDKDVVTALGLLLKGDGFTVIPETNPENILSRLASNPVSLILLDMNFRASVNTGNEGIYWLHKIRENFADIPVVMITAYADIDIAIRSLKEGAADFIVKPWNNQKLLESVEAALLKKKSVSKQTVNIEKGNIIWESSAMTDILRKIDKIAPTDANILILGENGTGKDLVANLIHQKSLRNTQQFIKVDIGSLTETIFESELFGYKKGAFTDAREDRTGRIVSADKGTLFLDEIGNITLIQQAKLLTVLQNRQVTPLGSNAPQPVDIRLICATNLSLKELSNESRFRKDLIYRINTIELTIPPLRARKEDIPVLTDHFISLYGSKYFKPGMKPGKDALAKLNEYHFPGNVRELQYIIERAVIMSDHDVLTPEDIVFSPLEHEAGDRQQEETNLEVIEKRTILKVIENNNGNISKAAKELGITRTALYRRLGKYEI